MNAIEQWINETFSNVGVLSSIQVTFQMAVCSTAISALLGIPLGLLLEKHHFPGRRIAVRVNRTLMGVPPVVIGLLVYMLLMRRGPLGAFRWLFTIKGMVLAQTLIITPIICGMVYSYAVRTAPAIRSFAVTMGANPMQTNRLMLREMKNEIYFAILSGFGRSISEVGAVMLVGGNIKGNTRTMTTAISLLKSQGIFTEGVALGLILLLMAFLLQCLADFFRKEEIPVEND